MPGVRELLQKYKNVVIIVVIPVIIASLWFSVREASDTLSRPNFDRYYYTTDDGKSWFADYKSKLAPFETGDGVAVRAVVYRGKSGEFLAFLERYKAATRSAILEYEAEKKAGRRPTNLGVVMGADTNGKEVKKPGASKWFDIASPEGRAIAAVPVIDGQPAQLVEP